MRYLALDIGDKRTGLALGDDHTRLVSPAGVLQTPIAVRDGRGLLDAIARACEEHLGPRTSPGELVVGLPLNMDGSAGPRAELVRALAERIAGRTGRVVHLHDERLSSAAADWAMARTGLTHGQKKARRDALAAGEILKDFLSGGETRGGPDQNNS